MRLPVTLHAPPYDASCPTSIKMEGHLDVPVYGYLIYENRLLMINKPITHVAGPLT